MDFRAKFVAMLSRPQHNGVVVPPRRNPVIANRTISLLRKWRVFSSMSDEELLNIKSFYVFHTPPYLSSAGGVSAVIISSNDVVLGVGHNSNSINVLGFSEDSHGYLKENISTPTIISALCQKGVKEVSVGSLVAAAITESGTLLWWGHCYRRQGGIMTPEVPTNSKRKYVRVSCGYRMMVALSESKKVFAWGQVVNNNLIYMEGEQIIVNAMIVDISCGLHHLAMMDKDGTVFTWGRGNEGQRGLPDYDFSDQYRATKLIVDPCTTVKCGPYSTFCLTKFRELRACGSNCEFHLGTDDPSRPVKTLSRISITAAITDVVVLWGADDIAKMAACTSEGDIYTWGPSAYPILSRARSFFEVFSSSENTPGLTSVSSQSTVYGWSVANIKTPRELKSINVTDVVTYVHHRDRPQLVEHPTSKIANKQHIANLSSQDSCEESGKNFILEKYFRDFYHNLQDYPTFGCVSENGIDVISQYSFKACSRDCCCL